MRIIDSAIIVIIIKNQPTDKVPSSVVSDRL